ncbi:MAG: DNA-deoxyinosine glycosylase [Desulfopila sp.]
MDTLKSFRPLVDQRTTTLILGSMPGHQSLMANQYYAHPRNGFWHIMGHLFGAGPNLSYAARLQILLAHGIGLWDVIDSCRRPSSLDADIVDASITTNDFPRLLARFPAIDRIFFNGAKAEQTFNRRIRPHLPETAEKIQMTRLISTSPANARYSLADKIEIWQAHLGQGKKSPDHL